MALDPLLQALQNSLNAAISGGQLVLNGTTMGSGSPPVVALFQQVFGRSDITIGGTIQITPDEANDKLLVSGTGVTQLFNVSGTAVALTFGSATISTLNVTGTITPPATPPWTFAASFPDLAASFFGQLAFTGAFFTISTYAWRRTSPAIIVVEGAGLCIQPTGLSGPLEPATHLATPPLPLPPFYGPVTQTADARSIALAMPFSKFALQLDGFPALEFPQPGLTLRNRQQTSDLLNHSTIAFEATTTFGFVEVPLAIVLPDAGGWALNLLPTGPQNVPSITSFLALFTGLDLAGALPADVLPLPGFSLTALRAQFDLDTGVIGNWSFTVTTAPADQPPATTTWRVIPGVLEIREITLVMRVAIVRPGGKGTPESLITGSLTGIFHIGGTVDIQIVIPIPVTQEWIFAMTGAVVLPGLRDLAKLVAGVDPGTLLPPGAGAIGDFTLTSVVLTLDPVTPAIVVFSFTLVSTKDWVIVPPNRLTIQDLQLSFQIDQPFGLRSTSGTIFGTLHIGSWNIDVVVDRQPYELDWSMQISSASMPLPSIADLDELAGTGLAPYLPQTLATASFTLYDLLIDVNLSQAAIRQLAFQLESDQPWTIIPDILVIQRAGLYVDLSWYSGSLLANFGIWGALRVVNTGIDVSADRLGEGEWTFRGALAPGETISLGGLVAQFLGIDPAYLPDLAVEGLSATFSTPSNDFALEGRTAGLWTFEISSALALRMRAEAAFRRTDGKTSGYLAGDFFINSLNLFVSYTFDPTSNTLLFRLTYGRLSVTAALSSGTNPKGQTYSLLTFRLGDLSFGEILEGLINLASPGSNFRLESPWDALNQINLRNLSLVVDLKTRDVTVNYDISLNLVFINVTGIGVKYDTSSGEGSVTIQLSGRFLDQEYSLASGNPLEWDVLHEPPPPVPAKGPQLFDLNYLGFGQHVSFSNLAALNTVGEVIAAMRAQMTPLKDPARNPLATGNGSAMRFDRASGILAGADFEILSTLSAGFVFNDPYLYGMRIALAGDRAGSLAGLAFELLYKKITNDIGVFKIELRVPDAFRQFEFGEVSITLPVIKVDVYTNGNFRVDLGFPRGGNFTDSFCLQVFPFIGWGGFYFAALTGATSERVPPLLNGSFNPVIEAGLGLRVGLGKEIRKGPLSGGIYVTVQGILEGTVAWFTPTDLAARDGTYYWVQGSIGIIGKVYGEVDFAVIKVSVRLEARLTVQFVLEAFEATHVQVTVTVEAEASVTIFFISISFSFSVNLDEQFVIGSRSTPPWLSAPRPRPPGEQPRLRMQETRWRSRSRLRELRLSARSIALAGAAWAPWDPILVFPEKQDLPLSLLPALTVATPNNSQQPALQIAFLLMAENGIAPAARTRAQLRQATAGHSSRTADPMTLSFNLLVQAMLQWAIYSVTGLLTGTVTAGDLEAAYALLEQEATFNNGFAYTNLTAFFANNFKVHISGVPANVDSAADTSGTVMAMLPPLAFTHDGTELHFDTYNPVSPQYEDDVRRYYAQLLVDYEYGRAQAPGSTPAGARASRQRFAETVAGNESMATLIFREYMMIVAKSAIQAARDCMARFTYPVTATDSLTTIAAQFPPVPVPEAEATLAVTPETIAWGNRKVPVTSSRPWPLTNLSYQINAGDSLSVLAGTFKQAAAANLIAVPANAANRQLLAPGATIAIAQPASTDYTWFTYTSVAGDALLPIAVWAFVRALPADPQPNGAWYTQTIVNFNTNPQQPYAGPNLVGVIATGTSLLVPAALNDADKNHALTYVTREGDTLDFIAAYYDILQNDPQLLQTLTAGLQTLNPGVDWEHLPPGMAIHVPAQVYPVVPGDSFASIAARFLLAPTDLAYGSNATATTLLAPLAVLALPTVTYTTGASDTIASVAEKFNTTVFAIAADIATVGALFNYPVSLTIPEVPAYPTAALVRAVILGQYANEVAMSVSRFVASGLRLPTLQDNSTLGPLYVLTGQQQACPTPPSTFTFTSSAAWIDFVESAIAMPEDTLDTLRARHSQFEARNPLLRELPLRAGMHLLLGDSLADLPIVITQALLDAYAPSLTFDPEITSGPSPLDLKRRTAVTYRLDRSVHWQTPQPVPFAGNIAAPVAGEPSIWLFPDSLEARAATLGWGTTPFALFTSAGDPAFTISTDPVQRYDWAMLINLSVRQAAATQGEKSLPNIYEIAGSDADGKARLLALLDYLTQPGQTDTAQLFIFYAPNADTNNPNGLASAAISKTSTFVLRTNLSTLTASGPHTAILTATAKDNLYAATLAQATDFIQLLWEASVTAGGYFLNYTDTSGNGLPNDVFAATALGELRILVILATQSAKMNPNRKLYAFNNCAVAGDNIDAGVQTVFAAVDDATKIEWRESASIPPGNAGFALTRTNPGTADDPEHRTQELYSLLAYHAVASGGFTASNEGLPVSPVRPDDTPPTIVDAPWQYTQVLRLGKLATSTLPEAPFLPPSAMDPYAGIAPGGKITLAMDFHDVYGNETVSQTPIANLNVPVGYFDDVIGMAQWPGLAASYHVAGSATAPIVAIDASLQVCNYVPGGGASFDAVQNSASAHQARFGAIYYQIWQAGVTLTLTTSLVQQAAQAPSPFAVDRVSFANFVSACYIFLGAAQQFHRASQIAGTGTLSSIAQSFTAGTQFLDDAIAALALANQDIPTAALFAASLAMPALKLTAFGDTLTDIVARAGSPAISVIDLATNNAAVPLNAGIEIVAPGRISAPVTAQTRLADIAELMHAMPGAIGDTNATVRGLLAVGAPVTVGGVTILVEVDPISGKTWSFADLEAEFDDDGVTATPAIMAVANQEQAGLFATGQTLTVTDYILQPGDSFANLAQTYSAFTITALATAASDSPNLFRAGVPLFIRAGTPTPPSPTQTLRALAETSQLTVPQIALANWQTGLVGTAAVLLPDRVTIDVTAAAALTPYTVPGSGIAIAAIVQTFAEASALDFATRNWTLAYIFVPSQPIAIGAASTTTQANDSFASVYGRLHAEDSSITQMQFVNAIAPSTTLIRAGALFAVTLPSTGTATTTLKALANSFGADPSSIAQVNASLVGFVVPQVPVRLGVLSLTTGPNETFENLVRRFAQELDVQTTVAAIAQDNLTTACFAAQQRFLLPPAPLTTTIALPAPPPTNPPYPGNPFALFVDLTIARDADRIDPQFAGVASVAASTLHIAPRTTAASNSGALSLDAFAQALELVYPALKVAVGGDATSSVGARDLWIVNFGPGGVTSISIDSTRPSFFALPPLATSLQDLTRVPIRRFDASTGKLTPETAPPLFDFQSVDLDVWTGICFAAIDQMLTPPDAAPAFLLNPAAFSQLVGAKQTLAQRVSATVTSIVSGSSGIVGDAAERIRQQLLVSLATGYATTAVVQYPVQVASGFTAASAPRLICEAVNAVFHTGAVADLATLATYYGLPQTAMAMLLAEVVRILAIGTVFTFKGTPYTIEETDTIAQLAARVGATGYQDFVANLATPNGFFQPHTVLNIDRIDGAVGDASSSTVLLTFADIVDYFHTPLPLLATMIAEEHGLFIIGATISVANHGSVVISHANNSLTLVAAALHFDSPAALAEAIQVQTAILNPLCDIHFARFVPEYALSSSGLSLANGSSTMNTLFDVRSQSRAKNMFVRLDIHVNEIEYDIVPVASGFDASRWLSFIVSIGDTAKPLNTSLGEVLIPIPLRAYPSVPSMLGQSGAAAVTAPRDVANAKAWRYAFEYQHHLAAQDTLYIDATFNVPLHSSMVAAVVPPALSGALAQFVSAWPAIGEALTALVTWNTAPNPVLAQTLQTFADMATAVAAGWAPAFDAADDTAGTTYSYGMSTTVRSTPDGLIDYLDTLRVSVLSNGGASPTGGFPQIDWRQPGGGWRPLDLRSQSATEAVYVYVENVPGDQTIQHQLSFAPLDSLAWQNGTGSARLTRNEHLISAAPTAPVFIYNTNAVGFAQPTVPLIQHDAVIVFNNGLALQPAIANLFATLLGLSPDYWVKVSVEFGYELVPTVAPAPPIASFLPIGFLPTSKYDTGLPDRVYQLINTWRTGKPFGPTLGLFSLDVTVFTTLTAAGASKVPILRLQHLVYNNDNNNATTSFAQRLWSRRPTANGAQPIMAIESTA